MGGGGRSFEGGGRPFISFANIKSGVKRLHQIERVVVKKICFSSLNNKTDLRYRQRLQTTQIKYGPSLTSFLNESTFAVTSCFYVKVFVFFLLI